MFVTFLESDFMNTIVFNKDINIALVIMFLFVQWFT